MTKDISFDLETLSTDPQALILSIGAVKFDRDTGTMDPDYFYRIIDIEAPGPQGVIDPSTVAWWMRQSQEARDAIFGSDVERTPLRVALAEFADWIGDGDYDLWQRGDKDSQWLVSAFKGNGLEVPYKYWRVRDQRTLCDLFKPFLPLRDAEQTPHNALGDAYYQAHCLVNTFARLRATGTLLPEPSVLTAAREVHSWLDDNRDRLHTADCTVHAPSARCSCGLHSALTLVSGISNGNSHLFQSAPATVAPVASGDGVTDE